jgi:hypothetical protein
MLDPGAQGFGAKSWGAEWVLAPGLPNRTCWLKRFS